MGAAHEVPPYPPPPVRKAEFGTSGVQPKLVEEAHERTLKDQANLAVSRLSPRSIVELMDEYMQRLDGDKALQLVTAAVSRMPPEHLQKVTTTALMRFAFEVAAGEAECAEAEGNLLRSKEKLAAWRTRLGSVAQTLGGCGVDVTLEADT